MLDETQKKVILDTSVYGRLVSDEITLHHLKEEQETHHFIIYGTKVIRSELRKTPRSTTLEGKKLRILLLGIYDSLVKKDHHDLIYNKLIETLSQDYFKAYKKEGGSLSSQQMKNDLIIIATATIYQLDVVISDDQRSMFSDKAISAYSIVNKEYGLKNPAFKAYSIFKEELSRRRSFRYES